MIMRRREKKITLDSIFKSPKSYRDPNQRVKKKPLSKV
jgi:hypothetical protein